MLQDIRTGFVYIWRDKKNKMNYIGCHIGLEDDGYICSSRRMLNAYKIRPQDFRRRILSRNIPIERLLDEEHKWLSRIPESELNKKYYNCTNKQFNHWTIEYSEEMKVDLKKRLSEKAFELHADENYAKKYKEGMKLRGPTSSAESVAKIVRKNTGKKRSPEAIQNYIKGARRGENHPCFGVPVSEERKQSQSKKMSGENNPFFGKTHTEETRRENSIKISQALKGKKPKNLEMFVGTYWWNDGTQNKRSKECPGESWVKGKIPRNNKQ